MRPRVAFVSDAHEFAGAEHYLIFIIAGLRERFEFVVLTGRQAAPELQDKVREAGGAFVTLGGLTRRPALGTPLRLARLLHAQRPALVHVNLSDQGDGIAGLLGGRLVRAPLLATLHNVIPGRAGVREAASTALLRLPAEVIAVSDRIGRYLDRKGSRGVVIKNAVMPPQLDARARERLGLPAEAFVVGGIGRLHAQKAWEVLCRAAELVHATRPEIQFVVVGEGPERDALEREPSCAHVRFHGYVPDASSLLGGFDLLAIPSRYEGLGLVAIEGMLAGVPIVASDIEGLVEAIEGSGRLVPPEEPRALAHAILELADDPAGLRTLAEQAVSHARRSFPYERMIDETARVYDRLIGA